MKKKLLGSLLAALFVVGLVAAPAAADVNGAAVFTGTATVGNSFVNNSCPKSGAATVQGNGLGVLPGEHKNAVYQLTTTFDAVGEHRNNVGVYAGTFSVCGWLGSPANANALKTLGVGGSCLSTKGNSGRGEAGGADPATGDAWRIKLYNIGWKAAAGAILPVTGNYEEYVSTTPGSTAKKNKHGTIVALVGVSPVPDPLVCLSKDPGAKAFTVVGAAALFNDLEDMAKNEKIWGPKKCEGVTSCPHGPGK